MSHTKRLARVQRHVWHRLDTISAIRGRLRMRGTRTQPLRLDVQCIETQVVQQFLGALFMEWGSHSIRIPFIPSRLEKQVVLRRMRSTSRDCRRFSVVQTSHHGRIIVVIVMWSEG